MSVALVGRKLVVELPMHEAAINKGQGNEVKRTMGISSLQNGD